MNHIQLTIQELDSRIAVLSGIRDNLKQLFPVDGQRAAELLGPSRVTPPQKRFKSRE